MKNEAVNKEMEHEAIEDQATFSSSTAPTRTSASWLAAKLKSLMLMELISATTTADTMDTETKDKKKCVCTLTVHTGCRI